MTRRKSFVNGYTLKHAWIQFSIPVYDLALNIQGDLSFFLHPSFLFLYIWFLIPLILVVTSFRFPGGRCYDKYEDELKVRVRAQFLYPRITYSVNMVFKCSRWTDFIHYRLDGETKYCMVNDTYNREDGSYVVPLYTFTSDQKTINLEINFIRLMVGSLAGFEFQPLEENVSRKILLHKFMLFDGSG